MNSGILRNTEQGGGVGNTGLVDTQTDVMCGNERAAKIIRDCAQFTDTKMQQAVYDAFSMWIELMFAFRDRGELWAVVSDYFVRVTDLAFYREASWVLEEEDHLDDVRSWMASKKDDQLVVDIYVRASQWAAAVQQCHAKYHQAMAELLTELNGDVPQCAKNQLWDASEEIRCQHSVRTLVFKAAQIDPRAFH